MNDLDASCRRLYSVHSKQRYLFFENKQYLNLSSNDYLGLSSEQLQHEFLDTCKPFERFALSNPSSRLMTGNSECYDDLEHSISQLFGKENALVLSCGYMINSSLLGAISEPGDLIIADKLVHASIVDGMRLSLRDFLRFRHGDMAHLRSLLEKNRALYKRVFVVVESIYSMDGDVAPIMELIALKKEFNIVLYVDEAHAFGVRGKNGAGLAEELGVGSQIDIIVATLGKATASQGGFVVCSNSVKELLINKMRGLIFSTALPDISLMWSKFIIDRLPSFSSKREHLKKISTLLAHSLSLSGMQSHIIPIVVGSNEAAVKLQMKLRDGGYWVSAIRHPTVAKGSERIRISLSADITEQEMNDFTTFFTKENKV
ncbi:MAG: 8-amino-7-oxononanoate synthase [Rikenellaceae bacterium]